MKLKHVFILALIIKIASACYAALFIAGDGIGTWTWGFIVPLFVMFAYMFYGYIATRKASHEDKLSYGDSCYYLGFLFTVASIIFALYIIGTYEEFTAQNLAVRFAAAMVTTLLGMAVRVYLVTFDKSDEPLKQQSDNSAAPDSDEILQPGQIKGIIVSGRENQEAIVEANISNLELLNRSLVLNIDATEKLRTNLVDLSSKIEYDMQQNSEAVKKYTDNLLVKTTETLGSIHNEFRTSLEKVRDEFAQTHNKLVVQQEELVRKSAENIQSCVKNIEDAAKSSIQSISSVGEKSIDSLTESEKRVTNDINDSISIINKGAKEFSERLSAQTMPTEEWKKSLTNASDMFTETASNFSRQTGEIITAAQSIQRNITEFGDALSEAGSSAASRLDSEMKQVDEATKMLRQNLGSTSSDAEVLSGRVRELDNLVTKSVENMRKSQKGLISRMFSKFNTKRD